MTPLETFTTEHDVAMDIVAALDMYDGTMGSDHAVIELVGPGPREDAVVLVLSDGSEYQLRVTQLKPTPDTKETS